MPLNLFNDFYRLINFPQNYHIPNLDEFIKIHEKSSEKTSIRINPKKFSDADFLNYDISARISHNKCGYHLNNRPSFIRDPLWHAGAFYVQESSSMYIGNLIAQIIEKKDNHSSLKILDLCASPGGKSTDVVSHIRPQDLLISNEIHPLRSEILYENSVKWGHDNVWVTNNQPSDFSLTKSFFDIIIIDAPCSGSGMWRKDNESIREWSIDNVNMCALRQKKILNDIIPALAHEGIIIYSTCSYSIEENEDIIRHIADEYNITDVNFDIDNRNCIKSITSDSHISTYRCAPWHSEGEGFFFSAFQFSNNDSHYKNKSKNKLKIITPPLVDPIEDRIFIELNKDSFNFIHNSHDENYMILSQNKKIKFKKIGTKIGEMIQRQFIPDHEWILSIHAHNIDYPTIELNLEDSLQYLRRESVQIDSDEKGWKIISYNKHNLGLIKALGNRTNNYYPKNWRIRHA